MMLMFMGGRGGRVVVCAGIGQRTTLAACVGGRRSCEAVPEAAHSVDDAKGEDEGDEEGLHGGRKVEILKN